MRVLRGAWVVAALLLSCDTGSGDEGGGDTGGVSACQAACDRAFDLCSDAGFPAGDHASCRAHCGTADASAASTYESCIDNSAYINDASCTNEFVACWEAFNPPTDNSDAGMPTASCDDVCAHVQTLADADPDCVAFPPGECASGCEMLTEEQRTCMLGAAACSDLVGCSSG